MQSSLKTILQFVAHSRILTVAFLPIQSKDFRAENLHVNKVIFGGGIGSFLGSCTELD